MFLSRCWWLNSRYGGQRGFTYVGALVLVVVTGIALTSASTYWSTIVKREKEEELLFRGDRLRAAIGSFYESAPSGRANSYPSSLEELLKDPRFPILKRHIRKIYRDPMTKEGRWGLILDSRGGIKGVFSLSKEIPAKQAGFPKEYSHFENAKSYSDWKFVYVPKAPPKPSKK